MAKRKLPKADRERLEQMHHNARRTRELAEKGLADLERKLGRPIDRPHSNAAWLRELAERGEAELKRRNTTEA